MGWIDSMKTSRQYIESKQTPLFFLRIFGWEVCKKRQKNWDFWAFVALPRAAIAFVGLHDWWTDCETAVTQHILSYGVLFCICCLFRIYFPDSFFWNGLLAKFSCSKLPTCAHLVLDLACASLEPCSKHLSRYFFRPGFVTARCTSWIWGAVSQSEMLRAF